MTWLRETPYSLHYDLLVETLEEIQGNDLGQRNNVKDWAIRRRVSKATNSLSSMIGYGTVSETAKASVINDRSNQPGDCLRYSPALLET
jgi:hypothetical protein